MFNRLLRMTNNMKLKHKLIVSYILVVMVPVLIIGGIVVAYFRQQAMDRAIEQTTNNVEKIKTQLNNTLRMPFDVSDSLLLDQKMEQMVTTHYESVLQLTKAYLDYDGFKQFRQLYREIDEIRFYYDNPTLINNLELVPVNDMIESAHWYQKALETKNVNWLYIDDKEEIPVHKLSLVRQIPFVDQHKSGVLIISLNQDVLNGMLLQEPFETLITDEQGYVVAAQQPSYVGKTLDKLDYGADLNQMENGTHKLERDGETFYAVVDELQPELSMTGLKIISVFSTDSIVKDANKISLYGLLLILLVLLIALFFVYTVSLLTTNRMLRLSRHLNRLALGDLSVELRIDGNDEIGQLSRQFNYMVQSIRSLVEQVVEKTEQNSALELAQHEIKLKMMASQINPHFLFNALESIRMNALMNGEKQIANVVRLLGKLMRKNLEVGREQIPLKEEIEMVRSYLEIQQFRYDSRLSYELHIDEGAAEVMIPPLIVQPLVENSIVHGIETKESGGKVEVTAQAFGDKVQITVRDNGMGMYAERLAEVTASISAPEESGKSRIGLRNVHQRLIMLFGEQNGLRITSRYGEGTEIVFEIPR